MYMYSQTDNLNEENSDHVWQLIYDKTLYIRCEVRKF